MSILVEQLEAPQSTRWATVEQVQARPGMEGLDPAYVADLLDEHSAIADRLSGWPHARARYRERVEGRGSKVLQLSRIPAEQVVSLELDGSAIDAGDFELYQDKGQLYKVDGFWKNTAPRAGRSPDAAVQVAGWPEAAYVVDYYAGYSMPGDSPAVGPHVLDPRLRAIVILMVRAAYWLETRGDPGIRTMKKADRTYEFADTECGPVPKAAVLALQDEAERLL